MIPRKYQKVNLKETTDHIANALFFTRSQHGIEFHYHHNNGTTAPEILQRPSAKLYKLKTGGEKPPTATVPEDLKLTNIQVF
jgi:hypothetical protein